jgi:hypothetical protein
MNHNTTIYNLTFSAGFSAAAAAGTRGLTASTTGEDETWPLYIFAEEQSLSWCW